MKTWESLWGRIKASLEELWVALFAWIPTPLGMILRLCAWRWMFKACGSARLAPSITLAGAKNISLGSRTRIGKGCFLTARNGELALEDYASVSPGVNIGADDGSVFIGKYTAVGPGSVIRAANHCFERTDIPIIFQGHRAGKVIIGEDVWIGANCVILPNVRIGRGAVIGAGAVVARDVEPWAIMAGVPARKIGERKKG